MRSSPKFLIAIALLLCAGVSLAQDASQASAGDRLKRMADELNLTDAQKEKIKPILEDEVQKLQALRADTSQSRREKFSKAKEINKNAVGQIRPLLNPDQQKKYDEMRKEMKQNAREKMRERRSQSQ
ncbi:MAG TPA: hypothetical protein VG897_08030 [Terriglobales bacterium]|nr:hypothetical protein [Terriglobales bacterium]